MFRNRIIPVLLLKKLGLVKSVKFKNHNYIGDPINAVKIFNDKKADELVFLDIDASREKRLISLDFVRKVGDEANMPFAVGGGIKTIADIKSIIEKGAEKIVLGAAACENTSFIKAAVETFGSSTIVVCLDIVKNIYGEYMASYLNGKRKIKENIIEFAQRIEEYGAGEIIVQSVDRDGTYEGYNIDLIRRISVSVNIPVVALGGTRDYKDFKTAVDDGYASAVAAGSIFVYHGPRKAVLISYPTQEDIKHIF